MLGLCAAPPSGRDEREMRDRWRLEVARYLWEKAFVQLGACGGVPGQGVKQRSEQRPSDCKLHPAGPAWGF